MKMSNNKINYSLPPLPKKIKKCLYKTRVAAISNKKYLWGINIIEKYAQRYSFSDNEKYGLGLLYDHLAINIEKKNKNEKRKKYLTKAEIFYKEILKKNPKYHLALYGIGRIYDIKGDYKKALYYQIKAFRQMLKLPKAQRGALAIGVIYQKINDYKNAEKWYLKEYEACRKNDFGTTLNLFNFYKTIKNYKKAFFYGLKTEKLLKTEFKKKQYKDLKMKNSDFLKYIKKEINEIKNMVKNKGIYLE